VFLIDTNVLVDLANPHGEWKDWSAQALGDAMRTGPVAINPIIYAELSVAYDAIEVLDDALDILGVARLPLPYEAGFLAGHAFLAYRRAGGLRTSPLPDFYIGAHAAVENLAVITRDPRRVRAYFPSVRLINPEGGEAKL
jgi:predicted nucleic acid-binding protein